MIVLDVIAPSASMFRVREIRKLGEWRSRCEGYRVGRLLME